MTGRLACARSGMNDFGNEASSTRSSASNTPPTYRKYRASGMRYSIGPGHHEAMARQNRLSSFDLCQPVADRFACCSTQQRCHASDDQWPLFGEAMVLLQTKNDR